MLHQPANLRGPMKLTLREQLTQFGHLLQAALFPVLAAELGELTESAKQLVATLEMIPLTRFIPTSRGWIGELTRRHRGRYVLGLAVADPADFSEHLSPRRLRTYFLQQIKGWCTLASSMVDGSSRIRVRLAWYAVVIAIIGTGCRSADRPTKELMIAEQQVLGAANDFARGDPKSWKAVASHGEDVTLFGGAGGEAKGWSAVGDRYTWASAAFSGGSVKVAPLTRFVDKNLAVTVALEQWDVRFSKTGQTGTLKLRVTHVFRREGDSWRLAHRHADPLTATHEIDSVVHLNQ